MWAGHRSPPGGMARLFTLSHRSHPKRLLLSPVDTKSGWKYFLSETQIVRLGSGGRPNVLSRRGWKVL